MCWFTYDIGRTIGIVAKNDIEVYKVMVMKPLEDEELFYSAYRYFPYKKGDLYELGSQMKILKEESNTYYRIFKGFHSYNSQSTFLCKEHNNIGESLAVYSIDKGKIESYLENDGITSRILKKVLCVIPKGSVYFESEFGEIVSNKIIIKNVFEYDYEKI